MSQPFAALSPADQTLHHFLLALDVSEQIEVTDWEAQFIANLIDNPRSLTESQQTAVAELRAKYEHAL